MPARPLLHDRGSTQSRARQRAVVTYATVFAEPCTSVPFQAPSRLMKRQFLYPKIGKLADKESVLAAAIDGVHCPEFLEQPSGTAKLAEDRSVQAHPVYLTGGIDIVPRIGIGNVQ